MSSFYLFNTLICWVLMLYLAVVVVLVDVPGSGGLLEALVTCKCAALNVNKDVMWRLYAKVGGRCNRGGL